MSDAKLGVVVEATNKTSDPIQSAAKTFLDAAQSIAAANESIAKTSEKAADQHEHHAVVMGHHAGIAAELTEKMLELGERIIESPVEAFERLKESVLAAAKAQNEAYTSAERLGVSSEFLTTLGSVAKETGASSESLEKALQHLATTADEGGEKWKHFGVPIRDSHGALKDLETLFVDAAEKVESYADPVERAAAKQALFGRGGKELSGTLSELAEKGIGALEGHFENLGTVIDSADAKLGREFTSSVITARETMEGLERNIASAFEPIVIKALGVATEEAAKFSGKLKDSRKDMTSLAVDGSVALITGVDGVITSFRSLETEANRVFKALDWLKSVEKFTTFGVIRDVTKEVGRQVKELADNTGILSDAEEAQHPVLDETHAVLVRLKESILALNSTAPEVAQAEDTKAKSYAKTSGELSKQLALHKKQLEMAEALEHEAARAREELAKIAQEDFSKGSEREIASLHRIFAEQRKVSEERIKDYKLQDELEQKQEESAKKTATTIAGPLAHASAFFLNNLIEGKNVLDGAVDAAKHLAVQLAEAAIKAALIAAIKGLLTSDGGGGGGGGGDAGSSIGSAISAGSKLFELFARDGGVAERGGLRRMASGGVLSGGTPGVDSIPVLAMEGEGFLRRDTVSALQHDLGVTGGSRFANGGVVGGGGGAGMVFAPNFHFTSGVPANRQQTLAFLHRDFLPAFKQLVTTGGIDSLIRQGVLKP